MTVIRLYNRVGKFKYVMWQQRDTDKIILGVLVANNKPHAIQVFARQRQIATTTLSATRWHKTSLDERAEATAAQQVWERDRALYIRQSPHTQQPLDTTELHSTYERTIKILRQDGYLD